MKVTAARLITWLEKSNSKDETSNFLRLPIFCEVGDWLPQSLMINPSPYKTIAVASTFSPRFEQVLSEAKRIRDRFGSVLSLIYVGERNAETAKKFSAMLAALQLPRDSAVYYQQGSPADGILRALSDNKIDMVVAGALE